MSSDTTPIDEINNVRYRLGYCYYALEDHMRTALIGEFLATRFPNFAGSQKSAGLAMFSYWKMYSLAPPESKKFEQKKVDEVCSLVLDTWPKSDEAAEAVRMLISIAIQTSDLDRVCFPPGKSAYGFHSSKFD